MKQSRKELYQQITNQIISELEQGTRPWHSPWETGNVLPSRPLRHSGEAYQGINTIVLWLAAKEQGFDCPHWFTYRQVEKLGGHVTRGEKGTKVFFSSTIERETTDRQGRVVEEKIPFLKSYSVFNGVQCENLPDRYFARSTVDSPERIQHAEDFLRATGAKIREGGTRAYYSPDKDLIQMPSYSYFRNPESFVAVLSHETIHWSGSSDRLNREFSRFGDKAYAVEELTAEMGAAFLCADLKVTPEVLPNHAAYIDTWLSILKEDNQALFKAATSASLAVEFVHGLQPEQTITPQKGAVQKSPQLEMGR